MRLAIVIVLSLLAVTVHADNRTEAILLFDQGLKEMKAGQFEKACNSFERSIAAAPDSGTKGSLAKCYEKLGRLASSWLMWRELADLAPSGDLRRDAAAQAAKLEPRVAHYLIKVAAPTPGLTLMINGKATALIGTPVPVDAGGVIVRAYAAGHKDWSTELSVTDGNTLNIDVPTLDEDKIICCQKDNKIVVPIRLPPPHKSKRKPVGFAIAGVGAVVAVVGGAFGFKAKGKYSDAKDLCGGSIDDCNGDLAAAQKLVDDARSAGNLSTVMFVVGGAAIVGGIVLVVTAPKSEKPMTVAPMAGSSTAGLLLSGHF